MLNQIKINGNKRKVLFKLSYNTVHKLLLEMYFITERETIINWTLVPIWTWPEKHLMFIHVFDANTRIIFHTHFTVSLFVYNNAKEKHSATNCI